MTVKFEDYTRDEVQATLQWLFEQQYELTLTEVVEIRTRTTSSTDPETGETTTEEEDYEYYILNVKLRNKGLNSVISNSGLSEDDMERYRILLQTRGNRPDIFGNDIYATPGGEYTDYDIPGEALTDTRFANMIREAEKYLGWRLSAKLDRIGADLEKARKKRAEWDAKVKDLERRYREEENSEIHEMVHAANLNPEQLSELLRMFAADMAPKPDTINTMNEEETQNEI